jgi:hypothetical protein
MRRATYEAVSLEAVLFEGGWLSPSDEDVLGRFVVASFHRTFRLVPTTLYVSFNDVAYFICFSWLRTLLLLSSMKTYDNPFIIAIKIIGGMASRQRARSMKQSGGWKPKLRHKQPYGSKWETPEGKLQHRTVAGAKSNR